MASEKEKAGVYNLERLIVFSKYPVPGKVKTRLIPELGAEGAADLHRHLAERTVDTCRLLDENRQVSLEICHAGGDNAQARDWLGPNALYTKQEEGTLGERMAAAFARGFEDGYQRIILVGTDCPGLSAEILDQAFEALFMREVVLGPAEDGGYYLVGLAKTVPQFFSGIAWGTSTVLEETLRIAEHLGLSVHMLPRLTDVDRPQDLAHYPDLLSLRK